MAVKPSWALALEEFNAAERGNVLKKRVLGLAQSKQRAGAGDDNGAGAFSAACLATRRLSFFRFRCALRAARRDESN